MYLLMYWLDLNCFSSRSLECCDVAVLRCWETQHRNMATKAPTLKTLLILGISTKINRYCGDLQKSKRPIGTNK